MKYFRIFFLYFQQAFVHRGRSVVWFFISLFNPLVLLLFWYAALTGGKTTVSWSLSDMTAYYVLLIISASFLDVHIEENIAVEDISEGGLNAYVIKPVSYAIVKLCTELPYRILQGSFGIVVFCVIRFGLGIHFPLVVGIPEVLSTVCMIVCAFCVSFLFKMIVGISAFWTTDYKGIAEMTGVLILLFGGFVIPLEFFPSFWRAVALYSPFPYGTYFPVLAVQGRIALMEMWRIIGIQVCWIFVLGITYRWMWKRGIRLYTGVGL